MCARDVIFCPGRRFLTGSKAFQPLNRWWGFHSHGICSFDVDFQRRTDFPPVDICQTEVHPSSVQDANLEQLEKARFNVKSGFFVRNYLIFNRLGQITSLLKPIF